MDALSGEDHMVVARVHCGSHYAMIAQNLVIIARNFKSIVTEGNPLGQTKAAMGMSF